MSATGNDLARVLRWGPGYTGGEDPLNLLRDVIDAEEIRLDRWTVVFHPEDKPEEAAAPKAPPNPAGKKKKTHARQQQALQSDSHQPPNQHHHHSVAITTIQTQGQLVSQTNKKKKKQSQKFLNFGLNEFNCVLIYIISLLYIMMSVHLHSVY